ncbi:ABC transporter permease subunit [Kitasatospora sp. MAP5-34]|uniref:ABC transporter permease subunit n=1 Tax=Kitasatospora sp. MAP5-34 TaxID=3035102 RepID=UPI002476B92A|nr:ABC transporter permease subunit [Kitasatospora sp. MAP5-34]MDH6580714.1 ABC-type transport system involved in multi-copper enzyme maturation permease subunit [Kitasatospora sp. MAP5-34]
MSTSKARIGAVVRKEFTEFRRSRFILATMAVFPVLFLISPTATILATKASVSGTKLDNHIGLSLMILLLIPVFLPSTIAAYSVIGERDQGTLEPMLTTPIRREELLIGKAVANLVPAVGLAYLVFGIFLAVVAIGADPVVASAVWHAPQLIAEVFYVPLLAAWSIWVGLAISTKAGDNRVAQQLSTLASLPPFALIALMSFQVITPTLTIALSLAGALLVIDGAAYLLVSKLFDRERLITGTGANRVT